MPLKTNKITEEITKKKLQEEIKQSQQKKNKQGVMHIEENKQNTKTTNKYKNNHINIPPLHISDKIVYVTANAYVSVNVFINGTFSLKCTYVQFIYTLPR